MNFASVMYRVVKLAPYSLTRTVHRCLGQRSMIKLPYFLFLQRQISVPAARGFPGRCYRFGRAMFHIIVGSLYGVHQRLPTVVCGLIGPEEQIKSLIHSYLFRHLLNVPWVIGTGKMFQHVSFAYMVSSGVKIIHRTCAPHWKSH